MKAMISIQSMATRLSPLVAALVLAGCSAMVQTPFETPALQTGAQWQTPVTPSAVAIAPDAQWWQQFNDPQLNALIESVLERNNDLAAATLRVRRAQLAAGLSEADQLPQLNAGANVSRSRSLDDSSVRSRNHSVSASVNYEVDLWGKLGSQHDAARWAAIATEEDLRSTQLSLIGTTMNLYWQAAFLNQRLAHSDTSIAHARRTLDLIRTQYEAGAVSGLEMAEADRSLINEMQSRTTLEQQLVENRNALAILLDGPPGNVVAVPASLPDATLPEPEAGVPAQLLGRRPDLRAAETRLRQALANTDAVRASYYPSISLTGSLGSSSVSLTDVLSNPIAGLGVGINLPFLNWTRRELNLASSNNQFEEAVVNFRQSLYSAMRDVENTLSARGQLRTQAELLQASLKAAQRAEELYEVRYRAGAAPLRMWLDAQQQRRAAEIAVTENRLSRYANQVLLYQALGGEPAANASTASLVTPTALPAAN